MTLTSYTRAHEVIDAIKAIDVAKQVTQEQGEQIAHLLGGDRSLFIELDERPGQFDPYYPRGEEWHWKLRQARNGCERFFDVLAEDEQEAHARAREQAIEALAEKHGRVSVRDLGAGRSRVVFFDRGLPVDESAYIVAKDGTVTLERGRHG